MGKESAQNNIKKQVTFRHQTKYLSSDAKSAKAGGTLLMLSKQTATKVLPTRAPFWLTLTNCSALNVYFGILNLGKENEYATWNVKAKESSNWITVHIIVSDTTWNWAVDTRFE